MFQNQAKTNGAISIDTAGGPSGGSGGRSSTSAKATASSTPKKFMIPDQLTAIVGLRELA
jgi:hypothetical protein